MGKISALFMISLCFLFSANAQLKWGANAGVNISSITHVKDFNPKPLFTFQFSGFAIIPIGQSLEMQPCLGYRGKGYGVNERYRDSSQQRVNYDYNYLQLSSPVLLRCNTNDNYKWYAGAGPYLAYLINVKWDGSNVPMDSYHRIDFGIDFS